MNGEKIICDIREPMTNYIENVYLFLCECGAREICREQCRRILKINRSI